MNWTWISQNTDLIGSALGEHLLLALLPVLASIVLSIPIGFLVFHTRSAANVILAIFGAIYSIPSLALFVVLPLALGTKILDPLNVAVALTIYTTALLSRSVVDGLREVPADVKQAADAIGYGPGRRFWGVDLPLSLPVIFAGLRVATVSNIALTSISVLIGTPSLGTLFDQGFNQGFLTPVWVGLILSLVVALLADLVILLIQRGALPWARRAA
ncbi:glycine/betaine ABC transporter permease [Microlunatus endophyticus]|uniref:Glycine/betaine ABC transporter permease n=1 Tax=Microlunatus endophyticus TaxID=1716077 RepID=A0A917W5K0_9ACTN|nr:ABC transporter permease subunit [Microlunatus endophyticus]GGL65092.1 glycine/betaine ABC transporter permease [Microlunatus endophyticus]